MMLDILYDLVLCLMRASQPKIFDQSLEHTVIMCHFVDIDLRFFLRIHQGKFQLSPSAPEYDIGLCGDVDQWVDLFRSLTEHGSVGCKISGDLGRLQLLNLQISELKTRLVVRSGQRFAFSRSLLWHLKSFFIHPQAPLFVDEPQLSAVQKRMRMIYDRLSSVNSE